MHVSIFVYIYGMIYWFFIWLEFDLKVLWEATPICSASKCARCSPLSAPWCSQCPSRRGSSLCLARSCLHICIYKEHTYSSSRVAGREQRNMGIIDIMETALTVDRLFSSLGRAETNARHAHTRKEQNETWMNMYVYKWGQFDDELLHKENT